MYHRGTIGHLCDKFDRKVIWYDKYLGFKEESWILKNKVVFEVEGDVWTIHKK